jgi:hypothetical protein
MTSSESDLEEQLKEAGNKLLDPPSSVDDLLNLLDVMTLFPYVNISLLGSFRFMNVLECWSECEFFYGFMSHY